MLFSLLFTRPCFQLIPVSTLMHGPKPVNSVYFLINNFQGRVCLTHEGLTDKIDAMSYMAFLNVYWEFLIHQFMTLDGSMVACPVATPNCVL
jgi:hypothetical protein